MQGLFSEDVAVRKATASTYKVFPEQIRIPTKYREDWKSLLNTRQLDDGMD